MDDNTVDYVPNHRLTDPAAWHVTPADGNTLLRDAGPWAVGDGAAVQLQVPTLAIAELVVAAVRAHDQTKLTAIELADLHRPRTLYRSKEHDSRRT